MFRWLIGVSLKYRFLLLAASVALVVFGTEQIQKMPVDAFPRFAPPKVEIQTIGPGMTPSEVEQLITIPLEHTLRGTRPGVTIWRDWPIPRLRRPLSSKAFSSSNTRGSFARWHVVTRWF